MAFIGTNNLKALLQNSDIIKPFVEERIKNGSYELSLGNQVFQTDSKPRAVKSLNEGQEIYIEPGQFALLLTEEYVMIPENKIAFISIKASIKFKGLVNVSGFHVDPGFEGKLLFSVYNAGPKTIVLSRGTAYFPIWFADIDKSQNYEGIHQDQRKIPNDSIEALSQGELASPNVLSKRIEDVKYLNTRIDWAILIFVGLLIALTVKVWTDSSKVKDAVDFGYNKKTEEINSDSTYKAMQNDIHLLKDKIDSLNSAVNTQTPKNK